MPDLFRAAGALGDRKSCRAARWLAGCACLAASATACASSAAGQSAGSSSAPSAVAVTALASPPASGCAQALDAVSRYGPTVVRDHHSFEKVFDDGEIELLVVTLDTAADVTGNPAKEQSIRALAAEYQKFRDVRGDEETTVAAAILADTNRLDAVCGS